jgi:hypothetical protein
MNPDQSRATQDSLRHAQAAEYAQALRGIDFPAPKDAIVRKAEDKGGIDREVREVLGQIPDQTYAGFEQVMLEVERVYDSGGGLPFGPPAAPA